MFARLGMSATFYTDAEMLAKYPIKSVDPLGPEKMQQEKRKLPSPPSGSRCGIEYCRGHDNKEKL